MASLINDCISPLGIPRNLQAVWAVHLLTGALLIAGASTPDSIISTIASILVLFVSCLIVLVLCCYPHARISSGSHMPEGKHDLEKPQEKFSAIEVRPEPEAENAAEWDTGVQEAPLKHPTEENCTTDMLCISEDASVIEGVRCLLVHHLQRSNVVSLSESQAQLLEHHLERLAVYGQKIVHTIAFAQRVLTLQDNQTHGIAEAEEEQEGAETACQQSESESVRRKPKRLVLKDKELLEMYSLAQHEAQLEADWRGLSPGHQNSGRGFSFESEAAMAEERCRSREREAAIGLLGQALAARQGLVADQRRDTQGLSASEDLAQRLIPARPGPVSLPGITCCVPHPSSDGEVTSERPPAAPILAVTPAEARAWLEEAGAEAWGPQPA